MPDGRTALRDRSRGATLLSTLLAGFLLALYSFGPVRSSSPPPTIGPEPASLVIGQSNFTTFASANGPGGLSEPEFVAFDSSGDLWVSDYNDSLVAEYRAPFTTGEAASLELGSASFSTTGCANAGPGNVCSPNGFAFDPSGNLWVTDNQNYSIVEFKAPFTPGESVSTVIGGPSEVDGAVSATTLGEVYGIAFDASGNLWVADSIDDRVLEFKAPLGSGEAASLVLGQPTLTSVKNDDAQSNMSGPEDMAFDRSGNIWVADTDDSRVLEFSQPFSDGEKASMVIGEPDYTSIAGNDTRSALTLPEGIAFDPSGDLWVADSGNSRVLEFAAPFSPGMDASDLIGQDSYFSGGPNATQTGLGYPQGIAFDPSGNLWVADPGFSRVLEYSDPLAYTSGPATTGSSTTTPVATTISTSSSSSGGGVPVLPYQLPIAAVFMVLLVATYLLVRRRVAPPTGPAGQSPSGSV